MITRILCIAACFFTIAASCPAVTVSDSLVDRAWNSWKGQSSATVEELFREAVKADPANTRAHLGLALLYTLTDRDSLSWDEYHTVLRLEKNPYPYVFATWLQLRFTSMIWDGNSGIVDLLKELTNDRNADGMLRAASSHILGRHYRLRGKISESDRWFAEVGSIKEWTLIGPFENVSASGYDKSFPPEHEYDNGKTVLGKNDVPAAWFTITVPRPDCWNDFKRYFADADAIFYANTFVYSDTKRAVQVRIGTSGSLKAFLNDELVLACPDEHNNDLDTYMAETVLQQGWNRLLVKCGYSDLDECNFLARLTDSTGTPLEGLKVSTDPQVYRRAPGAPVRSVENFAEAYFKGEIAKHPEHIENYVLLSDCYLRNDKANDAELVLREAIRRLPDCPLLFNSIVEAFVRGKKNDEITKTIEKARLLEPDLLMVQRFLVSRALENEEFDEARNILSVIEKQRPGSEFLYEQQLAYYAKREQFDKVIELNAEAIKKYPSNWGFAYLEATIASKVKNDNALAAGVFKEYLNYRYSSDALNELADCYLRVSDFSKWEKTAQEFLDEDPCAPGWYNKMSRIYQALEMYDKAARAIRSALKICPNSSAYWARLGDILRIQKDEAGAIQAYRSALAFSPTNYDARESLRDIQGKKSIFSRFLHVDPDSLIRTAPKSDKYPNDAGVILLDDMDRVVYDRGASVSSRELLVKLFTAKGIQDFKEFQIHYNSNIEGLIVEKAVTMKKDGSEVKADVSKGLIVFKSLEENDCIYLKWKIKNYYSGRLSSCYWDTFYFNGYYPKLCCRYALLVPDSLPYRSRTQNMPDSATCTHTEDGTLYEWVMINQPAIAQEQDMPGLDDIGKILYISSIPSWEYMVGWYSDLTSSKVKSSFEIKEAVRDLFSNREGLSDSDKTRLIYEFITKNIQYSNVSFRQSGLVPQKARDVLTTRIGDCKDMATLCIAMLAEAGIESHYVLVNTSDEGRNVNALPAIVFNHCIVAVKIDGSYRYLDLTASDNPIGTLPPLDMESFALRIIPGEQSPITLPREAAGVWSKHIVTLVSLDGKDGIFVSRIITRRGAATAPTRSNYRFKGEEDQRKELGETLGSEFPGATIAKLEFTNLDTLADRLTMSYDFDVPQYVTKSGKFRILRLPWNDNVTATEALSYQKRNYEYIFLPRADTMTERITMKLPKNFIPVELPAKVSYSCPAADYTCSMSFTKGVLTADRLFVKKKYSVSPEGYDVFRKFYGDVVKQDGLQLLLNEK